MGPDRVHAHAQDNRIRVIHQVNTGLVGALNRGFSLSQAPYVVRMDNDDVAFPDRIQHQHAFMEANPDCVVCGGAILDIDSEGAPLSKVSLATEHDEIVQQLLARRTGHFHPTTIIRTDAFKKTSVLITSLHAEFI